MRCEHPAHTLRLGERGAAALPPLVVCTLGLVRVRARVRDRARLRLRLRLRVRDRVRVRVRLRLRVRLGLCRPLLLDKGAAEAVSTAAAQGEHLVRDRASGRG